jgi:hypothetical protein
MEEVNSFEMLIRVDLLPRSFEFGTRLVPLAFFDVQCDTGNSFSLSTSFISCEDLSFTALPSNSIHLSQKSNKFSN